MTWHTWIDHWRTMSAIVAGCCTGGGLLLSLVEGDGSRSSSSSLTVGSWFMGVVVLKVVDDVARLDWPLASMNLWAMTGCAYRINSPWSSLHLANMPMSYHQHGTPGLTIGVPHQAFGGGAVGMEKGGCGGLSSSCPIVGVLCVLHRHHVGLSSYITW